MGFSLGDPEAHRCAGQDGGMLPSSQDLWSPGHPSNTALSPHELQGEPKAGAWCVSCGKCPAKVSAINKSIIKGGCTLAFEHTPGRAYFSPSKESMWGKQRGGGGGCCKGPRGCRRMRCNLGLKMEDQEEEGEIYQAGKLQD